MTEPDEAQRRQETFRAETRRLFMSEHGRKLLYALLIQDFGLMSVAETPEQVTLKNYAVRFIRERLGLFGADETMKVLGEILNQGR